MRTMEMNFDAIQSAAAAYVKRGNKVVVGASNRRPRGSESGEVLACGGWDPRCG